MGQKVNPHGLRVGVIKNWDSRWFVGDKEFGDTLVSDYQIRKYLKKELQKAGVPKIEIERDSHRVRVFIHCAKPGMVIGKGGAEIDKYKAQLENRVAFRRAMKMAIRNTMRLGAKGIKISCGGRLGGAEIAKTEHYHEGTIPLQTLRADIEYGFWEANTTYGKIGIKVWIYRGEVLNEVNRPAASRDNRERRDFRGPRGDRRPGNGAPRQGGNRQGGERRAPKQGGAN